MGFLPEDDFNRLIKGSRLNITDIKENVQVKFAQAYAYVNGMTFGRWIDTVGGAARDNGYSEGELIDNVAYVIESIYRDHIFAEYDLTVDSTTSGTVFVCSALRSSTDDYYNNAIITNITTGGRGYVTDYVGSSKTLTISGTTVSAGDNFILTNVQGDNRIDHASFDKVGNKTNGQRDGWKYRFTIAKDIKASELIDKLCFEAHLIKLESYNKIRLVALDTSTAVATWGSPLKQNGVELAGAKLSPIEEVYTDYRLNYAYDYGKGEYTKEYAVNRSGFTPGASLTTEQSLCAAAEDNYKIKNQFVYNADFIYDDATAKNLLQKLVLWHTKQRLMPVWYGSIKNYIQYEIGDVIKINYSAMIPTGLNNTVDFMIYGKEISSKKKIVLSFIEL